jgi:hypothetical protein
MADDIYNGTLEHRSLTDHAIKAIMKQLRNHPFFVNTSGKAGAQIPHPPPWEMIHPPGGDNAVCM